MRNRATAYLLTPFVFPLCSPDDAPRPPRRPRSAIGTGISDTTDFEGYTYDANNNQTSVLRRKQAAGQTINLTYDALNRLITRTFPTGTEQPVYYGYDLLNRLLYANFNSATGPGIANTWDALGRQTSTTNAAGQTLSYAYDLNGNRTQVTWPDAMPNSLYMTYVYDCLNRMTQVEENGATSGVGVLATYVYNSLGQTTAIQRASNAGARTLANYDPADRLGAFTQHFASASNSVTYGFSYDGADQLLQRTATNDAYSYHAPARTLGSTPNGLNQFASMAGTSFTYDGRGNETGNGTNTFGYDLENHLLTVALPTATTFAYDPLGRLQSANVGGTVTSFLYDGANLVGQYNSAGIVNRYAFGAGVNDPIVWYQGAGNANRNWLQADNQNSVIAWSNATGALTASQGYAAFGEASNWSSGSLFAYTGQIILPGTQLYYYKARVYDPVPGRFLQTDPIGYSNGINWYNYAGANPVTLSDPLGLEDDGQPACQNCAGPGAPSTTTVGEVEVPGNPNASGDCSQGGCPGLTWVGPNTLQSGEFNTPAPAWTPLQTIPLGFLLTPGPSTSPGGASGGGGGPQSKQNPACTVSSGAFNPNAKPTNLPSGYSPVDIGGGRTDVYMQNAQGQLSLTPDYSAYSNNNFNAVMNSNNQVGAVAAAGGVASLRFSALGAFSSVVGAVNAALALGATPPPPAAGCPSK